MAVDPIRFEERGVDPCVGFRGYFSMRLGVAIVKLVGVTDTINMPAPSAATPVWCLVLSTRALKAVVWFVGLKGLGVSEVVP